MKRWPLLAYLTGAAATKKLFRLDSRLPKQASAALLVVAWPALWVVMTIGFFAGDVTLTIDPRHKPVTAWSARHAGAYRIQRGKLVRVRRYPYLPRECPDDHSSPGTCLRCGQDVPGAA